MGKNGIVLRLIEEATNNGSSLLDLGNCGLTEIPEELMQIPSTIESINFGRTHSLLGDETKCSNNFKANNFSNDENLFEKLSKIRSLKKVGLSGCSLRIKNIVKIDSCESITHLDLGWNRFDFNTNQSQEDILINQLAQLKNLEHLDLRFNKLRYNEFKGFGNLTKLTYLNLAWCEAGDVIMKEIGKLINLRFLDVELSHLTDRELDNLKPLKNLEYLSLKYNYINSEDVSCFRSLKKLVHLNVCRNKIGSSAIQAIASMEHLTHLDISANKVSSDGFKSITKLTKLRLLDAHHTNLNDGNLSDIDSLINLKVLNLSANNFTRKGLRKLQSLPRLEELTLYSCNLTSESIEPLQECHELKVLNLGENKIDDNGLQYLKPLSKLTELVLCNNKVDGSGLFNIKSHTNLVKLDIARNNIESSKLDFLEHLVNLQWINISGNQINDHGLIYLINLKDLNTLFVSNNKIQGWGLSQLKLLNKLNKLTLSNNLINDIGVKSIKVFTNLLTLHLSSNNISKSSVFKFFKNLVDLSIRDNQFRDIPASISEKSNCINDLKIWWEEIGDGTKVSPNKTVKLQILGNGNAGKSSTLKALREGICEEEFKSTHGIVIKPLNYQFNKNEVQFRVWDFGGQEIYYGTHKLFISSQAIHLIIAEEESERLANEMIRISDRDNKEEMVSHQPLQYYIDLSKRESPKSARIIAKNKIDLVFNDPLINRTTANNDIPLLEISAKNGTGINDLRKELAEARNKILHYKMLMPISWLNVQQYFTDNLKENIYDRRRLITNNKFEQLCERFGVSEIARNALLEFLHDTGIVYKNDQFLKGIIIIDQEWALDAIYKPLDRKSSFYDELRNDFKGRVRVKRLFKAFGEGYEIEQKWLFLSLMRSCNLCFSLHRKDQCETEESYYVFPEFLPENETPAVRELWKTTSVIEEFTFSPEYLDYSSIQGFIVALGNKTKLEYIWRNGILVTTKNGLFKVEVLPQIKSIKISIESSAIDSYLWLIIKTFKSKVYGEGTEWLTPEGDILDLVRLEEQAKEKTKRRREFNSEEGGSEKEKGSIELKTSLPFVEQNPPKRLVISFASENFSELEAIEESLANYELNGTIQVEYDNQILDGRGSWDEKIKDMFLRADGYLMLVSLRYQNAKKKKYIWNNEIPIIEKRTKEENVFAYCITVSPVRYNDRLKAFHVFRNNEECLPERGNARDQYLVDFVENVIEKKFLKNEGSR